MVRYNYQHGAVEKKSKENRSADKERKLLTRNEGQQDRISMSLTVIKQTKPTAPKARAGDGEERSSVRLAAGPFHAESSTAYPHGSPDFPPTHTTTSIRKCGELAPQLLINGSTTTQRVRGRVAQDKNAGWLIHAARVEHPLLYFLLTHPRPGTPFLSECPALEFWFAGTRIILARFFENEMRPVLVDQHRCLSISTDACHS